MLNMTSAYYTDQLAEKLQLMLATGELRIGSWYRDHNIVDDMYEYGITFELVTPNWPVRIEYRDPSEVMNFNKMLQLLAEKLANRANVELKEELDKMNPKERV